MDEIRYIIEELKTRPGYLLFVSVALVLNIIALLLALTRMPASHQPATVRVAHTCQEYALPVDLPAEQLRSRYSPGPIPADRC